MPLSEEAIKPLLHVEFTESKPLIKRSKCLSKLIRYSFVSNYNFETGGKYNWKFSLFPCPPSCLRDDPGTHKRLMEIELASKRWIGGVTGTLFLAHTAAKPQLSATRIKSYPDVPIYERKMEEHCFEKPQVLWCLVTVTESDLPTLKRYSRQILMV